MGARWPAKPKYLLSGRFHKMFADTCRKLLLSVDTLVSSSLSEYLGQPRKKIEQQGREVGGEFRIGNTCTPVADSC